MTQTRMRTGAGGLVTLLVLAGLGSVTPGVGAGAVMARGGSDDAAIHEVRDASRGRGADDGAGHDLGDDHGRRHGGRGADDGAGHDLGDDHGRRHGGRGADDGAGHDLGDDHGRRGRGTPK